MLGMCHRFEYDFERDMMVKVNDRALTAVSYLEMSTG